MQQWCWLYSYDASCSNQKAGRSCGERWSIFRWDAVTVSAKTCINFGWLPGVQEASPILSSKKETKVVTSGAKVLNDRGKWEESLEEGAQGGALCCGQFKLLAGSKKDSHVPPLCPSHKILLCPYPGTGVDVMVGQVDGKQNGWKLVASSWALLWA